MSVARFVGTSELQHNSGDLLQDISVSGGTCFITENGKARAVLMDITRYNALMDMLEETESLRSEPSEDTRQYARVQSFIKTGTRNFTKRAARR